jgi:uncharacterized protein YidB (DUF937 family)
VAVKAAHFARPPGLGLDGREHGDNIKVRRGSEYSIRTLQNADEKTRRINRLLQSLHLVFDSKNANASGGGIMGGIGDLLKGPLGGILAGASAGSIVNGGLSDLLNQFRNAGHGDVAGSWVGNGPNRAISPADLSKVLDTDRINTLMHQSGLSRDELLAGLSDHLPRLVDHLTPNGRVPTDQEMSRLV